MWAMACYGDDPRAEALMNIIRPRLNNRMFPAMKHLNGMSGDAMGYWYIYCPASSIWTLLSIQSAYGIDVTTKIRKEQGDWLTKQLESSIHGTLPNMRFIPWGDIQSGPDGGVTHEWAGPADAATWALKNPYGAFFDEWLEKKRGMNRFFGETAILYFLYTRALDTNPVEPPLAMLAGGEHSGQAMMRSSWKSDATVIGFRSTDYYQGHFHYDAGSFIVYRNGLLAVDAGNYTKYDDSLRAPIAATHSHNSLIIGGEGQRIVKGQWYKNLTEFNNARMSIRDDRRLETGDVPFYKHAGEWTAVAGQFAQAYSSGLVKSCVRQLLFVRPNTLVIVDNLIPEKGRRLPEVRWILNLPSEGLKVGEGLTQATNGESWIRCRSLVSNKEPIVENSLPTQLSDDPKKLTDISRVNFVYAGQAEEMTLVHLIEVGDGHPDAGIDEKPRITNDQIELDLIDRTFVFARKAPFTVGLK